MTAGAASRTRIVLVDDEPLLRSGLAMLLSAEPDLDVVGQAADGEQGVGLARSLQPDVVVMDLRMPAMDGVQATRELCSNSDSERQHGGAPSGDSWTPAVLILTTFDHDEQLYNALRAGAGGFLLKSAAPATLAEAIRALARGDGWLDPAVTRRMIAEFAGRPGCGLPRPEALTLLTQRELEVLGILAQGLSNTEIAGRLVLSEGTVKTHVGRIFAKLGLRDRAQAVALAYETGLVQRRHSTQVRAPSYSRGTPEIRPQPDSGRRSKADS